MSKVPTIEEFFLDSINQQLVIKGQSTITLEELKEDDSEPLDFLKSVAINFAKIHVEAALECASLAEPTIVPGGTYKGPLKVILKESVINSYPLENIK